MKAFFRFLGTIFFLATLLAPSWAAGLIIVDRPGDEPPLGRGIRPIHRFTPLEIRSVKVKATIKDQVAKTEIAQEFYNPNPNRLEGTFYLPLPRGAHLQKFAMEVNGKMTEAELLSADKAKAVYEEIVRKAQDPALLEFLGRDLAKVRIFPIEPNSSKRIELSYTQVLKSDDSLCSYSVPLNTAKYCATPIADFVATIHLETATELKTIYSPSHSAEIQRKSGKSAVIAFEQRNIRPERDFQLLYSAERSELGMSFLAHRTAGEEGYFMLLATPSITEQKVAPKDVVFVFDTSGSMSGAKMEQGRKALLICVNNLNSDDRFEVIRFSTETEALFRKLEEVTAGSKTRAESFINNLRAMGGTAIHDALTAALKLRPEKSERPFFVVFLTDGLPTVGVTNEEKLVEGVKGGSGASTRVFCFGIGTDVNTHLLDRIAEETRAVSQYVLPEEDLEVKLSSFFGKISDPILAGMELDAGSAKISKLQPGQLPDLFKGQQLAIFGRYSNSGETTLTLKGRSNGQAREFKYRVNFPQKSESYDFIPRLWATRRVGFLLDEVRLRGENKELREEITALATQYGVVTPYTSFLITEDTESVPVATTRGSADPLAFYRKNPELMRRYFPHLGSASSGSLTPSASRPEKSGDLAVADARYSTRLKEAESLQQVQNAPAEVRHLLRTGRIQAAPARPATEAPERYIGGRTFRLQGETWVETASIQMTEAAPIRLEFDTREYWDLVLDNPGLNDVLALGVNIRFLHAGKVYEVFAKKK
jgi:Ca-activated chloride channel homolog